MNSRRRFSTFNIAHLTFWVFAITIVLPFRVEAAKPAPTSSFVIDLESNMTRTSTRAEVVRPIASLTKLMAMMVVLDTKVNLNRTIAYDPNKHYAYRNWTNFYRGDRLSGQSLLHLTLTGSQNITARMLVGLSGLSGKEAVRRMNVKAKSLGLTQTIFVDVHGLSLKNVSTAPEVARMFTAALEYPDIAAALGKGMATVKITSAKGRARMLTFAHTNVLLKQKQQFATEASKTGYLDEAGDALAMRVRDPKTGHRFIVVTLGEPRQNPRFAIAKELALQSIQSQRIAGITPE